MCYFEVEPEDMCEEGPSTWEALADEWKEFTNIPGETCDSVTVEVLYPTRVKPGCEQDIGIHRGYARLGSCSQRTGAKRPGMDDSRHAMDIGKER